jgi:hypothetical protein
MMAIRRHLHALIVTLKSVSADRSALRVLVHLALAPHVAANVAGQLSHFLLSH